MVRIRLKRIGTKGKPKYRVVIANQKAARNGKFIEEVKLQDKQKRSRAGRAPAQLLAEVTRNPKVGQNQTKP